MTSRIVASLVSLCFLASGAQALQSDSALTIEYPIGKYVVVENDSDQATRGKKVTAFRKQLKETHTLEFARAEPGAGGPSSATDLRLDRVVPAIRILMNDPRYLLRAPVILEWLELVDERGRVTRVWVTASNQSKKDDKRIIEWSTAVMLRRRGDIDRRSTSMLRSAGVNLVTSPYHHTFWTRKLSTPGGAIFGLFLAVIIAWIVLRIMSFRRRQRMRHDAVMSRLHRASPYKAPSVDDDRG